jgi:hypothetical protein
MGLIRIFCASAVAGAWLAGASLAVAEPAPIKHNVVSYSSQSGVLANGAATEREVYSQIINGGDVPWIRLGFGAVQLSPGSRLRITSLLDGATQTLNATQLAQWQYTSAYFNGAVVRLTLIAGGGTRQNSVEVNRLIVGEWAAGTESQCGPTDDRVASSEPARARLLNIGCTASIYNTESCFITAGHCMSSPGDVNVVEFNVPPSQANGTIVHPAPSDQYVPTNERQFVDGGIGNDWGLFKVSPNTQTGLMPFEAQGASLTLGTSLPPVNTTLRIVGYGVDNGVANQTQQENSGPCAVRNDAEVPRRHGGRQQRIRRDDGERRVIGIHTNAGCNVGGGSNSGTAITLPSLQSALQTFCPADTGVSCGDIDRMIGRCTSGRVQVIVRMTDTSNQGETLVVTVDGNPLNVPINFGGGRFGVGLGNFGSGTHAVSLIDPAGCANVPDVQVTCP